MNDKTDFSISAAVAELEKLARFAKAIDGIGKVITALQSAEQVDRELTAKKKALEAEIVKSEETLNAAAATVSEAQENAKRTLAAAAEKAAKLVSDASAQAAKITGDASAQVIAARNKLDETTSSHGKMQQAVDAAGKELADLQTRITKAKEAARAMLG